MLTNLLLALQISALGMGLVFFAIILLWLMMSALTALQLEKPGREPVRTIETVKDQDVLMDLKIRAAAVAVAVALAEQNQSNARPLAQPPTAIISAWQLGMRTRQMYEKGERR